MLQPTSGVFEDGPKVLERLTRLALKRGPNDRAGRRIDAGLARHKDESTQLHSLRIGAASGHTSTLNNYVRLFHAYLQSS